MSEGRFDTGRKYLLRSNVTPGKNLQRKPMKSFNYE
jgi:hypothetical protein